MDEQSLPARLRDWINTDTGRIVVAVTAAAAVVLAIVVAVASRTYTQKEAAKVRARGLNVLYVCKACGASGQAHKAFDKKFPIKCPKCGKKEAVAAFRCVNCKEITEAIDAPVFECTHCGYEYDQRLLMPGAGK